LLLWLFQKFLAAGHEEAADVVVAAEDAVWLFGNLPAAQVVVAVVGKHIQKLRFNRSAW
jgi:hypothetical protein